MFPFFRVTSKALLPTLLERRHKRETTSLPLLLISLTAAMKGTRDDEWNYYTLLYALLSNVRHRLLRLSKGYGTWPRTCKFQVLPSFPYDTSRK